MERIYTNENLINLDLPNLINFDSNRYCEPVIRRAVPLALGLISVSNPQLNILDTLSKFSHDSDAEVSFLKSIIGLLINVGSVIQSYRSV